ncbi:membrane protein insertion efficiency factor YidD [Blattabacterium cuenoti]|uniref:membrane protein insertion efficiency factor YidD n=1 Tax=Blattabacterium cuenoti TaxID=1653831 RepID=UPI001EEC8A78|nr:membrane protein insertion efficiency factor YidD [Blattabacterium cuenoti]
MIVRLYQFFISPFIGKNCRYIPSCSEYMILSIKKYNILKAIWITIIRIMKCNPWGKSGYDPI